MQQQDLIERSVSIVETIVDCAIDPTSSVENRERMRALGLAWAGAARSRVNHFAPDNSEELLERIRLAEAKL